MLMQLVSYNIFSTYYTMLAWCVSILLQKEKWEGEIAVLK